MDRRSFLAASGAAGLSLWLPPSIGGRARPLTLRSGAVAGGAALQPAGTTLESSIILADGSGYRRLLDGPAVATVVRTELADAGSGRTDTRRALAAIVHLTDLHLVDAQSPTRVEFLDPVGSPFTGAWRAQETLSLQVAQSMVDRINGLPGGPITGRPFDCAVSTGDNIDNLQHNEAEWFLGLLDGGELRADSGDLERYEGVQEDGGSSPTMDATYWHPEEGVDDDWKQQGFPSIPGLLDAARQPFEAPGLTIPWYSTYGNHDGLVQGTLPLTAALAEVYTGGWKLTELPPGMDAVPFIASIAQAAPEDVAQQFESGTFPGRRVTPDDARRPLTGEDWIRLHLDSPATPGPSGHGYTEDHLEAPSLHYEFPIAPGVVGLSLDTGGYYSGSLGEAQMAWLEERLIAYSSRHADASGSMTTTGNDDQLIIAFSHFNPRSMEQVIADPEHPDEHRALGPEVVALFHRFPNFIAWVNGHHHVNQVEPMPDPAGVGGFWDINTASHIDYPQQSRLIELVDNDDGTLSIFCTMVEHAAPAAVDYADTSVHGLAAISRELCANDVQGDRAGSLGADDDRNVELVIAAPFDLRAAGYGETVPSTQPTAAPTTASAASAASADDDGGENEWATLAVGGVIGVAAVVGASAVAVRRRREGGEAAEEVGASDHSASA
jgi:metallophosphoesterase (TIGR03767 family)